MPVADEGISSTPSGPAPWGDSTRASFQFCKSSLWRKLRGRDGHGDSAPPPSTGPAPSRSALYLAGALLLVLFAAGVLAGGPAHAQVLPAITIEPHQSKVTGHIDWINYTLTRAGATTNALDVTVTLTPPVGNDWAIPADNLTHPVTFAAGADTQTLFIAVWDVGFRAIGFSASATTGGTLIAGVEAVTGYDTSDTAEVEVLVVPAPAWVVNIDPASLQLTEGGGAQNVVVVIRATSTEMPPPSVGELSHHNPKRLTLLTSPGTAVAADDYVNFSVEMNGVDNFTYQADPSGFQVGRRNIPVTIIQDSELEGDETFDLRLGRGSGPSLGNVQVLPPGSTTPGTRTVTYTVTIRDDENALPTASNSAVRTYANTDYTFAARDFKFADTNVDDALVSVKVVTLPASGKGTLKLNNTAIVETALPKTVTETELGQNKLVYSPPPMDMIGEDFASFTFRVSDGDVDSSDTYTMTVYVLPPIPTLVSNLGQTPSLWVSVGPKRDLGNFEATGSFTTGPSDIPHELASVTLVLKVASGAIGSPVPEVTIRSDSSGSPGPELFTLDNPSNIGNLNYFYAEYAFNAPPHTRLSRDTTYWVVVHSNVQLRMALTLSAAADSGGQDGWRVDHRYAWRLRGSSSAWSTPPARAVRMKLEGVVLTPTRAEPSNSDFPYSDQTRGFVDTSVSSIGRMDATLDSGRRTGDWWKLRLEPHRRYRVEVEFGSGSDQARGGGIDVNYDAALWDHNRDDGRAFIEFYASPESYHLRVRARDFLNDDSMSFYGRYAVSLIDITNITRKVSNTRAYSGEKTEVSNTLWKASSFTTGSNTGGYKLSYVGTGLHNKTGANSVRAELWTHSGGDVPGTKIFDFLRAGKITGHPTAYRTDRFWAPPNAANLAANTKYWVVFKDMNSGSTYEVTVVSTDDENPGAASGWSIGDPTMNYAPTATTPVWFTAA